MVEQTKRHQFTLHSIECKSTSESGHDEVYIVYQPDGGKAVRHPPGSYMAMDAGTTWEVSLVLNFDHDVLVTIYDQDLTGDPKLSDFLANVGFTFATTSTTYEMKNANGANYVFNYSNSQKT